MFGRELRDRCSRIELSLAKLSTDLSTAEKRIDSTSAAQLRLELNDTQAALESLQRSVRKELGKIWGHLSTLAEAHPNNAGRRDASNGHGIVTDDELAALLQLQGSPPAKGG